MLRCDICGKEFAGWGNNPYPIRKSEEARCCDDCNTRFVLSGRMALWGRKHDDAMALVDLFDSKSFEQLNVLFN